MIYTASPIRINDQYRIIFKWEKQPHTKLKLSTIIRRAYDSPKQKTLSSRRNFAQRISLANQNKMSPLQFSKYLKVPVQRINEICKRERGVSPESA